MASINATTSSGIVATADNTGTLQLQTAGATAIGINASQLVGIGNSSPSNSLSISNPSIYAALSFDWTGDNAAKARIGANHSTGEVQYWATTNYFPTFYAGNSERMRIDSSGNVLVGKAGTGFSTNGIELRADNELWVTRDSSIPVSLNRKTTTGELTRFHYNGTKVGDISTNGTGTTYNSSSDYRLKENIQPMIGALDKVAQLKPVTYTWKADGSNGQGFIAHELQEVIPDCVTGEKDAVNEDGSINPQGIDTSKLVATLTAAIQELAKASSEQQTIINDLKARIETLEAK